MKYCFYKHLRIVCNSMIVMLLVFCKLDANSQVFTESNLPIIIINTESVNNNGATNIYIRIGTDVANLLTKIHFS